MFHKLVSVLGGVLIVLTLFVAAGQATHAAPDKATVKGVVHTINLNAKTVSIKKKDGTTITLKSVGTTAFKRNGAVSNLKGLSLRDKVTAVYNPANLNAARFKAKGPAIKDISGGVTAASKSNGIVTLGTTKVHITTSTKIARNGELVSMSSLTRQDKLVAHVKEGTSVALDLVGNGPEEGEVHGTISAIVGSNITITPNNGAADVTVIVVADTMIEVDEHDATLADLAVGQKAEAHYDPTTMNAFEIEAKTLDEDEDAHISGVVAAVDTGAGTITITPNDGSADVTLIVTPTTEIEVNDEGATLADIQVGMPVRAEYNATTLEAFEIKAGEDDEDEGESKVKGTVAAVDTTASTITITPEDGSPAITLSVVADTEIEVNDEHGTLADIQVGMPVRAEYDPTTLVAFEIKAGEDDDDQDESKVEGTVAAVDTTASTITITPEDGSADVTLNVTADTKIEVEDDDHAAKAEDEGNGTLADIQVGAKVKAEYDPVTMNAHEIKVGDDHHGDDSFAR
ncbi:MAG: hypothetical protein HY741_05825 [Chloroflexi bacterium]|nr:hypothetical protein [Chloroflexota bacterium]